ncbi:hypothetical protein ACVIYH_009048 [Bradyrhizobium diazoefficiens]
MTSEQLVWLAKNEDFQPVGRPYRPVGRLRPQSPQMEGGMTDVLERLELLAAWLKPGGPTPEKPIPAKHQTLVDAIAEIKKLRAPHPR